MIADSLDREFRGAGAQLGRRDRFAVRGRAGAYGAPLYEFPGAHTRLQVNKEDPAIVGVIGLYASADPVADIAKSEPGSVTCGCISR